MDISVPVNHRPDNLDLKIGRSSGMNMTVSGDSRRRWSAAQCGHGDSSCLRKTCSCGTRLQTAASLRSLVSPLNDCVQKLDNVISDLSPPQYALNTFRSLLQVRVNDYLHLSLLRSHQPEDASRAQIAASRLQHLVCPDPSPGVHARMGHRSKHYAAWISSRHHSEDEYILPPCQYPLFIPKPVVSQKSENIFRVSSFNSGPSSARFPDLIVWILLWMPHLASVLHSRTHSPVRSRDTRSQGPRRSEIKAPQRSRPLSIEPRIRCSRLHLSGASVYGATCEREASSSPFTSLDPLSSTRSTSTSTSAVRRRQVFLCAPFSYLHPEAAAQPALSSPTAPPIYRLIDWMHRNAYRDLSSTASSP
ncbi:hypothetical protein K438DRAFT_1969663 [Mycena galopus ATCC 62051]|nr:hypothetical protein K438DRAFT_1969663 [Mycena galopus ATCC 62051]